MNLNWNLIKLYSIILCAFFAGGSLIAQPVNQVLDHSGLAGNPAEPGRDASQERAGRDFNGNGIAGDRGGNAGPAGIGSAARNVDLYVWQEGHDSSEGFVRIKGTARDRNRRGEFPINETKIPVANLNQIVVLATGGQGGRGGKAGRGQPGGNAYPDGRDAVAGTDSARITPPEPGRHGGEGGPAGNPTDGGQGGDGGRVIFYIEKGQEHLVELLALEADKVAGGRGGEAGNGIRNDADRASGGNASSGGKGYFQEEIIYKREGNVVGRKMVQLRSRPYGTSSETYEHTETWQTAEGPVQKTYTLPYRVENAPNGRPGNAGRISEIQARPGQAGRSGLIEIQVIDPATQRVVSVHQSSYQLRIENFKIVESNPDGVYEPGEKVSLEFVARNAAGSASLDVPNNQVVIEGTTSGFEAGPTGQSWATVPALSPGESKTLPAIELVISPRDFGFDEQNGVKANIQVRGTIPSLGGRKVSEFSSAATPEVLVRLPIVLHGFEGLKSLQPGEATSLSFIVENRSQRELDLSREVRAALKLSESEFAHDQWVFVVDEAGKKTVFDLRQDNKFIQNLGKLAAGEKRVVKFYVGVKSSAPTLGSLAVQSSASLNQLGNTGKQSTITGPAWEIRSSKSFVLDPSIDVLLVTSDKMDPNEISAWKSHYEGLGLKVGVYDLAVESILDLALKLDGNRTLAKALSGKTLVILDTEKRFLDALLRDTAAWNCQIALFGNQSNDEPLHTASLGNLRGEVQRELEKLIEDLQALTLPIGVENEAKYVQWNPTKAKWFGGTPKLDDMISEVAELQMALSANFPGQRFEVVYDFNPQEVSGNWFRKKIELGSVRVYRATDSEHGRIVSANSLILNANHSDWMSYYALSAEQKSKAFQASIVNGKATVASSHILEAWMVSLLNEISLTFGVNDDAARTFNQSKWPHLTAFAAMPESIVQTISENDSLFQIYVRLMASSLLAADIINQTVSRKLGEVLGPLVGRHPRVANLKADIEKEKAALWSPIRRLESGPALQSLIESIARNAPRNFTSDLSRWFIPESRRSTLADLQQREARKTRDADNLKGRRKQGEADRQTRLYKGGCDQLMRDAGVATSS